MSEITLNRRNPRQYLSRLNHRIKWQSRSKKTTKAVSKLRQKDDAVEYSQVKSLFELFAPYNSGHKLRRVGPNFDGGYLVPNDLEGLSALFSPGVSETLGFDLEIAELGVPAHLADASVDTPKGLAPNMTFTKLFLGSENKDGFVTLESWVESHASGGGDLMLQMDIEGAEYEVLENLPTELLERFRIILVEFHDFDQIFEPIKFNSIKQAVTKLNKSHSPCHIHPNNTAPYFELEDQLVPPVFEVSYIRRDRIIGEAQNPADYPHPLDQINEPKLPDPGTSKFWLNR